LFSILSLFFLLRPSPAPTPFPYTTLFRSRCSIFLQTPTCIKDICIGKEVSILHFNFHFLGIAPLYRNRLSRLLYLPHFRLRNPIGPDTSISTRSNSIAETLAFLFLLFKIKPQSCTCFQVGICCQ